MASKRYKERLQLVINNLHKCNSTWVESVKVYEIFQGRTVWHCDVEVFELRGHPKAKRCYGWSSGEPEQFITILELPPVTDAQSAVEAGVSNQGQGRSNKARGQFRRNPLGGTPV